VKLTADPYGKKVTYDGKVAGLGVGTGAAFALLPAQNATGNWIKVVQRVPVRIALDAEQLKANPLRVGLSMEAEVDIRQQGGKSLADAPRTNAFAQTQVYSTFDQGADAEVQRIIAANMGRNAGTAPKSAPGVPGVPAPRSQAEPAALHPAASNGAEARQTLRYVHG
jgi:membrane fusion protein (multidrug efflux system)